MPKSRLLQINTLKDLANHLGVKSAEITYLLRLKEKAYKPAREKGAKRRRIRPPRPSLMNIQRLILHRILERIPLPECVMGARKGFSVIDNARCHIRKGWVAKLDIKDFFPSVTHGKVYRIFLSTGCSPSAARILMKLTTICGQLPQGAPTSPRLATLAIQRPLYRLRHLCAQHSLALTVWIDDIAISGDMPIENLRNLICKCIEESGFTMHPNKIQFVPRSECQIVTGVKVNNWLEVTTERIAEIEDSIRILADSIDWSPAEREKAVRRLQGQLAFIRQIDPRLAAKLSDVLLQQSNAQQHHLCNGVA